MTRNPRAHIVEVGLSVPHHHVCVAPVSRCLMPILCLTMSGLRLPMRLSISLDIFSTHQGLLPPSLVWLLATRRSLCHILCSGRAHCGTQSALDPPRVSFLKVYGETVQLHKWTKMVIEGSYQRVLSCLSYKGFCDCYTRPAIVQRIRKAASREE